MKRRNRALAAICAIVAIAFAQLAVSAHACGTVTQTVASNAIANDANVCLDHCHNDPGFSSEGGHPPNSALVGNSPPRGIEVSDAADTTDLDVSNGFGLLPPATSLAILYGVLRI